MPSDIVTRTIISSDVIPTIEEAARTFRARETLEDYVIEGTVTKLQRSEGQPTGKITIYGRVEDGMRHIIMFLPESTYNQATRAHENFNPVRVNGTLVREGRTFRLDNPNGFTVLSDDE